MSIKKFPALGLVVQVTELDVSDYPSEQERRNKRDAEPDEFTPGMVAKQKAVQEYL